MEYKIGDYVKVYNSNDVKNIVDSEIINDTIIYYMSDSTSFAEHQIVNGVSLDEHMNHISKDFVQSIPENYWRNEIDRCVESASKKIMLEKQNNDVSWVQDKVNWWKWQLKFK